MLTIADFPTTDNIAQLENAIAIAESLAQSSSGANRQLAIADYTEIFDIGSNVSYLSYFPIVEPESIQVWYRGSSAGYYNLNYDAAEWVLIDSDRYLVDAIAGEIALNNFLYAASVRRPTARRVRSQIKVSYKAGFDFSSTSPEVIGMKSVLTQLVNQINSPAIASGIKSFEIDDEGHKTVYASASESSVFSGSSGSSKTIVDALVASFWRYRPRSNSFA
jgi:hypothetical protein